MPAQRLTREQCRRIVQFYEAAGGNATLAGELAQTTEANIRYGVKTGRLFYGITPKLPPKAAPPAVSAVVEQNVAQLQETIRLLNKDIERLEKERLNEEKVRRLILECDHPPKPPKWFIDTKPRNTTGVPTLFLSDLHWDEVVDPRQINGVNEFNRAVQERRLRYAFVTGIELATQHLAKPRFDYAVLPLGGDMVSGLIHEELRETNVRPVALSVADLADHLCAGIALMADRFGKVYIPCVTGNHGRIDKKPRAKNRAYDSYEWFLYEFVRRHFLKDDRIHVDVADGSDLYYKIYQWTYLLTHGDQAKGGTGISAALAPLMLMDHRKRKRALATKQYFDHMIMGHWHQYIQLKGFTVNGSLKGYDEWAAQQNFDFEPPQQAFWITHPEFGVTCRWPILLERPGRTF